MDGVYCQTMLEIAMILSDKDPVYENGRIRSTEHFVWIAYAMDRMGECHDEMWDETDGFYY